VVRDGEATALTAQSGTGKTTTLLRLIAAGWTPLAEDLAWLDPDSLTLYGWDRGIRLWQETID
jgi:ABC-type nitrate/sulfonate/bicarbonate transport system ATPase subunit